MKGSIIQLMKFSQPSNSQMASTKSFDISKQLVWRAYQRVKANKGAVGVDKISLSAFERNLKGNLYKIWNRMSSGSYMPPPVQQVNIPKKDGGTRSLGVPCLIASLRWWSRC
ncbi:hypothetical protein ATY36_12735 [Vibrio cidicii]|nr:hypothetical protein ATY36_12735 [Vibrio cidicii]